MWKLQFYKKTQEHLYSQKEKLSSLYEKLIICPISGLFFFGFNVPCYESSNVFYFLLLLESVLCCNIPPC